MRQEDWPSFGYLFRLNATTLWEYWGEPETDQADGPRSHCHPMMGGFDAWYYQGLLGINPDPENPGYKKILFRPQFLFGLEKVSGWYDAPAGRIECSWEKQGNEVKLRLKLPPNTTGEWQLPDYLDSGLLRENCKPVSLLAGQKVLITSGEYEFTCRVKE